MRPIRRAGLGASRITRRRFLVGGAAALSSTLIGCRPARDSNRYDLCVIGTGFAGTHLALRAAERGLSTVLVEAGRDQSQAFDFRNRGPVDYPIDQTRFIGLGGGSNRWTGTVARLLPDDFRLRSQFGVEVDWPIAYSDLEAYYCEAERLLSTRGLPAVPGAEPPRVCAYPEQGHRVYRPPDLRIDEAETRWFQIARSVRGGGAVRLRTQELPRFEGLPHATLLNDRRVTRFVSRDGRSVEHAELRAPDGTLSAVRARRFVVAAGVVESARLLLLSRSAAHPAGLGNDRGLVGRFFTVHPRYSAVFEARDGDGLPVGAHRTYSLVGPFRKKGLNACSFQLMVQPGVREWRINPEVEARAENRLALAADHIDAHGTPLPELHLGFSERDERTFARGQKAIRNTMAEPNASFLKLWHGHPAGPCRMGFDETNGVVDAHNKVFGTENLYVSGACVFPTSGTANPTNTVVAMTLRLADHLVGLS